MNFLQYAIAQLLILAIFRYTNAQWSQQPVMRIDDSNIYSPSNPNGIQYSSGWVQFQGESAQDRYMNTLSATTTPYASAALFFRGTSIAYYSDKFWDHDLVWVSVDGREAVSLEAWSLNAFQELMWSANVDEGDHQVVISRGNTVLDPPRSVTLDYLEVTYSEDVRPSSLSPGAIDIGTYSLLDDGHELISYEGEWSAMQPHTQRSFYFGGLQHTTTTPGSSLTFGFNGTAIYYFSDKRSENGWALISLDGGEGELVGTFLEPGDDRWFSQVLCWSKTGLSNGPHTIKITHSDQAGKYVSLDYFKYDIGSPTAVSKRTPIRAIIGASIGGGAAVLLTIAICYWLHRRSLRSQRLPEGANTENGNSMRRPRPEHSGSHPVSFYSEKWSPTIQSDSPRMVDGLNERSEPRVQSSYSGLPEI